MGMWSCRIGKRPWLVVLIVAMTPFANGVTRFCLGNGITLLSPGTANKEA